MDEKNNSINIKVENFARFITPLPIEPKQSNADKHVNWGEDNLYPNFLIDIADKSSLHGSILNSKSNYIYGDGLIDKKSGEFLEEIQVNEDDSLSELIKKCINDLVYFNAFAVEVTFNQLGEPYSYYHVPFQHVRLNNSKTTFFVNKDWKNTPRTVLSYPKYFPKSNDTTEPKIFYFNSYNVSVNNTYPTPDYKCIESAVTDMLVTTLFKNSVANGFSLTKVVKKFDGKINEEQKRIATKKFKDIFSGAEGENMLIEFNSPQEKGMEIDTIEADDYASKLIEVIKKTERNILSAHQATSSILFGIEKEGSLGNATELENAYQLFKNNYVKDKRIEIVNAFNKLFQADDRMPIIDLKDKEKLFKPELDSATKEKIMTVNELRSEAGLEPLDDGDKLLTTNQVLLSANQAFSSDKKKDDDEIESYSATIEDFEKVKHLGTNKEEFIVIGKAKFSGCGHYHFASSYNSIEEYLLDNKIEGMTLDEIAIKIGNELNQNISKQEVQNAIELLKNAGLISAKTNTANNIIHTAPSSIANANKIEVYYDYQKRDEADGNSIIPTTRHFCEAVINSNKYYSASDIQKFSSAFGYNVMEHCGGYWKNKKTGVVNKYCRHEWVPVKVYKP
ncbi:hypothetical protein [Sphingobacterium multivorum]|uniref:hypothetical protein n=1 Tax=Sphingobacterium multivorum TaxID=28454 RepID=UPI002896DC00|nr:hypothetical protein [Sphingobacterium multivorum]